MEKITLNIEERGQCGSGVCGRLRKENIIPAVVYGSSGTQNVQVRKADFRKMMLEKGERAALIELHCGSAVKLSLLQASQRNPRTDEYLHIDFKEVDPNKPMVAKVPLKFVGEPVGVKDEGGVNFIGFGSFTRAFKPEKEMNSFGTKKKIPAHYAVKFKAGKLFKNKVNEKA